MDKQKTRPEMQKVLSKTDVNQIKAHRRMFQNMHVFHQACHYFLAAVLATSAGTNSFGVPHVNYV